jgi:hypothetical protein
MVKAVAHRATAIKIPDIRNGARIVAVACKREDLSAAIKNPPPALAGASFKPKGFSSMPVVLDADSAAVYKAFQEAGHPAYETLTPAEVRAFYSQARAVTNPEPPELKSVAPLSIPSRRAPATSASG